jgi:hypothetical protein
MGINLFPSVDRRLQGITSMPISLVLILKSSPYDPGPEADRHLRDFDLLATIASAQTHP